MVDQPSPFAGYTPFSEDSPGLGAAHLMGGWTADEPGQLPRF
jgi:hypothetical protein